MTIEEAAMICYGNIGNGLGNIGNALGTQPPKASQLHERRSPNRPTDEQFAETLIEMQVRFKEMVDNFGIDGPSRRSEAAEIFTYAYNLGLARGAELVGRKA